MTYKWTGETVDNDEGVGQFSSLVFNKDGNPCISYFDQKRNHLKYAYKYKEEWQHEVVDDDGDAGAFNSLVLDEHGNPHISYYHSKKECLMYAHKDGNRWQLELVDDNGHVGMWCSIAVHKPGVLPHPRPKSRRISLRGIGQLPPVKTSIPCISYYDSQNSSLLYASKSEETNKWKVETADDEGHVGQYSSLTLDSIGNPSISYYDNTNDALKIAYKKGSKWKKDPIQSNGGGQYTSMRDRMIVTSISYFDKTLERLMFASRSYIGRKPKWHSEPVSFQNGEGTFTSLTFNRSGSPHISYYDYTQKYLKIAYVCSGGGLWYTDNVISTDLSQAFLTLKEASCSIKINPKTDTPCISCYDSSDNTLKYFVSTGTMLKAATLTAEAIPSTVKTNQNFVVHGQLTLRNTANGVSPATIQLLRELGPGTGNFQPILGKTTGTNPDGTYEITPNSEGEPATYAYMTKFDTDDTYRWVESLPLYVTVISKISTDLSVVNPSATSTWFRNIPFSISGRLTTLDGAGIPDKTITVEKKTGQNDYEPWNGTYSQPITTQTQHAAPGNPSVEGSYTMPLQYCVEREAGTYTYHTKFDEDDTYYGQASSDFTVNIL